MAPDSQPVREFKSPEHDFLNTLRDKLSRLGVEKQHLVEEARNTEERLISVRAEMMGVEYALDQAEKVFAPKQ